MSKKLVALLIVGLFLNAFFVGGVIMLRQTSPILFYTATITAQVPIPIYQNSSVPDSLFLRGAVDNVTTVSLHDWAAKLESTVVVFRSLSDEPTHFSFELVSHPVYRSVTIFYESNGGFFDDALSQGSAISEMRQIGINVNFVMVNKCFSGCFLVATFASRIFATENTTLGFNHSPSQFSPDFWNQMVGQIAHNMGWSNSSTSIMMQKSFNARNAVKAGVITGIYEG